MVCFDVCFIDEIDVKWCFDVEYQMKAMFGDRWEYVWDDVAVWWCVSEDRHRNVYVVWMCLGGWTLLKSCLMFVWTGPQDGEELDDLCLEVGDLNVGIDVGGFWKTK